VQNIVARSSAVGFAVMLLAQGVALLLPRGRGGPPAARGGIGLGQSQAAPPIDVEVVRRDA
jgi:hypothetical protein